MYQGTQIETTGCQSKCGTYRDSREAAQTAASWTQIVTIFFCSFQRGREQGILGPDGLGAHKNRQTDKKAQTILEPITRDRMDVVNRGSPLEITPNYCECPK